MKTSLITRAAAAAALIAATAATATAQNALDAVALSPWQLNGTARFMSMAGAFTALGGDMSAVAQNPGGIGVYRMSDVGATMAININDYKAAGTSTGQTKVTCPNFGYIGALRTGSDVLPVFNWGATYGRVACLDRRYQGALGNVGGSLSNYVAAYTEAGRYPAKDLSAYNSDTGYDPFYETGSPWLSALLYNAYAINPLDFNDEDCTTYDGLYDGTSAGTMTFDVIEKGYVDEYNITLGGNFYDYVSWGFAFGITDIEHTNDTYYTEAFQSARISNADADGFAQGSAKLGLQSWTHMWGTGFNFKAGVIVKPINELRIGLAVHTPTYYNMNIETWAQTNYAYGSGIQGMYPAADQNEATQNYSWRLRTPMRVTLGVAGVIDSRAIVSLDWEMRPVSHTKVSTDNTYYNAWGWSYDVPAPGSATFYDPVNDNINAYYRTQNQLRLGLEYRLSTNWSARAGFSYTTSPVTVETADGNIEVLTDGADLTGTRPSFLLDKDSYDISLGLGWHYKNFYADAAYVYHHKAADYWCYSNYAMTDASGLTTMKQAPRCELTQSANRIVLTAGFKF